MEFQQFYKINRIYPIYCISSMDFNMIQGKIIYEFLINWQNLWYGKKKNINKKKNISRNYKIIKNNVT